METHAVTRKLSPLPRDVRVYTIIEQYYRHHGFAPTWREIAKELDVTRQAVRHTMKRLAAMGCIEVIRGQVRGIVPIKSPASFSNYS